MSRKNTNYDHFAIVRFVVSIIALSVLALSDLHEKGDNIPNMVYMLIGGLNGVDAYKLYHDVKKSYDSDDSNEKR